MMLVLVHNQSTGQMQFITEGCDQLQGCAMMEMACRQIRAQTNTVPDIMPPVGGAPPEPIPERPKAARRIIVPDTGAPANGQVAGK